ncbi:MAG: MoaD/ThiS family protein [Pirellulales bacterium]|nr:MoaD/ThiS family protein [Pirellulales bacterium]
MPTVQVNLYAGLRSYIGGKASVAVEVSPDQTVRELLAGLGIPPEHTRILFVNGRPATTNTPVSEGDQVGVFPAIGGG